MRHPHRGRRPIVPVPGVGTVADVSYRWFEAPVRQDLEITQVYGYLVCPSTGRVLIQDDEEFSTCPEAHPKPGTVT